MNTFTRATSVYQVDFPTALPPMLDPIVDRVRACPLQNEMTGSGLTDRKVPYIRLRVSSDNVAIEIAQEVSDGLEFSIRTGYGVHQRQVV